MSQAYSLSHNDKLYFFYVLDRFDFKAKSE
jgi:hypothetical protein